MLYQLSYRPYFIQLYHAPLRLTKKTGLPADPYATMN